MRKWWIVPMGCLLAIAFDLGLIQCLQVSYGAKFKEPKMAVATEYWNSITGQWNAASFDGGLPVVGDTVIADGRSQKSFITSLDRSADVFATERVVNGNFATDTVWTKGTGWAIGSGVAQASAGSASDLSQAAILVVGRSYYVTYTVSGRTAGTITAKCGTTFGANRSTNATFTENVVCGTDTALYFSKSSTFDGAIDNVSVVESVGLDLAKFETTEDFRGDVGTPDQPWKGAADLFIHRGSGKLYFQPQGLLPIDTFVLDTPNLSHEVSFGDFPDALATRCVMAAILRGRAYYIGNGSARTTDMFIGYTNNAFSDAYVRTADGAYVENVTQWGGRHFYNGQNLGVSDNFIMAGGYCQFNGRHAIYIQTGGYVDFGAIKIALGIAHLTKAYLIGGTMDATIGTAGKTIATAYISPNFGLIEDGKLTIANRINLNGDIP